jgi:hypothetical protein
MSQLEPKKLHLNLRRGATPPGLYGPRRYTLTHSDATGDLFLTIGLNYDRRQVSGIYTRLMRDEVLAEWIEDESGPTLHVYCHVSGGLIFGTSGWRYRIFQYHLPMVLQAFRYGDRPLFEARPELDQAPVRVHFHSNHSHYKRVEDWGKLANYAIHTSTRNPMI